MKERPILFNGEMVRAILEGRKTQTRRVIKLPRSQEWLTQAVINQVARFAPSVENWWTMAVGEHREILHCGHKIDGGHIGSLRCPYGTVGDRLWVRETFFCDGTGIGDIHYRVNATPADEACFVEEGWKWRPSIFMPRWASRLTLEVTGVRVERVRDITAFDARAEGYPYKMSDADLLHYGGGKVCKQWFKTLWDEINAKRGFGWDANPFVWVVSFKRVEVMR